MKLLFLIHALLIAFIALKPVVTFAAVGKTIGTLAGAGHVLANTALTGPQQKAFDAVMASLSHDIENNFESMESMDRLAEHLNTFNPQQTAAMMRQIQMAQQQKNGAPIHTGGPGGQRVAVEATFNFNISAPINVGGGVASSSYGIPLFGAQDSIARYADGFASTAGINALFQAWPGYPEAFLAAIPTASTATVNPLAWFFSYYNVGGAVLSTWNITCNEYPYTSFLAGNYNNKFKLCKLRWTLNNAAVTSQYGTPFSKGYRTLFGDIHSSKLTVNQFKGPMQFQNGILDIDLDIFIGSKDFILLNLNPADGGSGSQMSFFVKMFERWDDAKHNSPRSSFH
jgi:hypothetical protein